MFRLVGSVEIGNFKMKALNSVNFDASYENFTVSGSLSIPKNLKLDNKSIIQEGPDSLFKRGDKVKVIAGYFPNQTTVFEGFVSEISPKTPINFKIEDNFWLLKQVTVKETFRKTSLGNLLSFLEGKVKKAYPNSNIKFETTAELSLTNFRINNASVSEVFDKLREYGLFTFFRENTLYCGIAVVPNIQKVHDIVFEKDVISDNLIYNKKDDQKIKLVAVSIDIDNKKIEVEVGDKDGELRTLYFYNLSEADLKTVAEREINRLKYEGFKGNFETFGEKIIHHGDIINLSSKRYPYKNGKYIVKSVNTEIGIGGYRQTVELDVKIK
jgi:hypothetical protein